MSYPTSIPKGVLPASMRPVPDMPMGNFSENDLVMSAFGVKPEMLPMAAGTTDLETAIQEAPVIADPNQPMFQNIQSAAREDRLAQIAAGPKGAGMYVPPADVRRPTPVTVEQVLGRREATIPYTNMADPAELRSRMESVPMQVQDQVVEMLKQDARRSSVPFALNRTYQVPSATNPITGQVATATQSGLYRRDEHAKFVANLERNASLQQQLQTLDENGAKTRMDPGTGAYDNPSVTGGFGALPMPGKQFNTRPTAQKPGPRVGGASRSLPITPSRPTFTPQPIKPAASPGMGHAAAIDVLMPSLTERRTYPRLAFWLMIPATDQFLLHQRHTLAQVQQRITKDAAVVDKWAEKAGVAMRTQVGRPLLQEAQEWFTVKKNALETLYRKVEESSATGVTGAQQECLASNRVWDADTGTCNAPATMAATSAYAQSFTPVPSDSMQAAEVAPTLGGEAPAGFPLWGKIAIGGGVAAVLGFFLLRKRK